MTGCDGPRVEPFGPTTRGRCIAGALTVMAGAVPVSLVTATQQGRGGLYLVLVVIGAFAMLGWAIDGTRYVGAGAAALALGLAMTVIQETMVDEYALLFGFLGSALLFVHWVNPAAIKGSAGLLLSAAFSAAGLHGSGSAVLPQPVVLALIMLLWGGLTLRRELKRAPAARPVRTVSIPASRSPL